MEGIDHQPPTPPNGATRAPGDYFTGVVWVKTLVPANDQTDCVVSDVTFEPGARNNWHKHPNGQILVATAGTGYYQEQGKPIRLLRAGDAVNIAPNLVHWHGATPDSSFTHIAINPNVSRGGISETGVTGVTYVPVSPNALKVGAVVWLQPVTEEEYGSYQE